MQSVTPVTYSIVNFLNAVISSLFFRNLMGGNNTEEKKKRGKKKKRKIVCGETICIDTTDF